MHNTQSQANELMTGIRDAWREGAKEFLKYSKLLSYYPKITEELIGEIPGNTHNLIDFGCGYGRLTRTYLVKLGPEASKGFQFFLIDNSSKMLEQTMDLVDTADIKFRRLCDDEKLTTLPPEAIGKIDAIACNSSIHLIRKDDMSIDVGPFLKRCYDILKPGGRLVASIPDQAYEFADGWESEFHRQARSIWGDSEARSGVPKFNDQLLQSLGSDSRFRARIRSKSVKVVWDDFVNFYSIPAMGNQRLQQMTYRERIAKLREIPPQFEEIDYRWVFVRFEKTS
jgi:SAM-dependent methyltransferase